jgi:hypothetical protein
MLAQLRHTTWLWGQTAISLTNALQAIHTQHICVLPDQPQPRTTPNLVILSSEPALDDHIGQLDPTQLLQDFEQSTQVIIDWLQRAIGHMRKTSGQQKGTIILLAMKKTDQPQSSQITTLTRHAGLDNLMQSLAREWGKRGIHLAYLSVPITTHAQDIADLCWQIHQQPISSWSYQPQYRLRAP